MTPGRLSIERAGRATKAWLRGKLFARELGLLSHHPPKPLNLPARYGRFAKDGGTPTISVVTPSFNHGRFLERTVRSVLDQRYPRLEYVVQDGGSTDETQGVLARYADGLHHSEMREDRGQADAINLGFEHASGEIMAFLNSDDLLLPGSLHYVGDYFDRHPHVDFVYGHRILIDERDMEIGRWILPRHDEEVLSWADYVPQETMFWRRRLWQISGGEVDPRWTYAMDWDLLLRFRAAGGRGVRLPRFLGAFRVHAEQKTTVGESESFDEWSALRRRELGRDVSRQEVDRGIKEYLRRQHVLQQLYRARLLRY